MQQTTNFKLNLPEGPDLFAPMHDYNPNWSAIDNQMQLNRLNSMQEADCIFAGGVFQLTRKVKGSTFFRFTAPADYTAGNTFTVDGEVFTAGLAGNFAALPDGAFTNGNIVVAYLDAGDAKKMALMTGSSPLPKDIDAKTLDGHGADYFATAAALSEVNKTATAAGNSAALALRSKFRVYNCWNNPSPASNFSGQKITLTLPPTLSTFTAGALAFSIEYKIQNTSGVLCSTELFPLARNIGIHTIFMGMQFTDSAISIVARDMQVDSSGAGASITLGDAKQLLIGNNWQAFKFAEIDNSLFIPTAVKVYFSPDK